MPPFSALIVSLLEVTRDDPDYSEATFNMNEDDCEEIGASGRFGHGQMVFVKSHIEDALDNIIGDGTDLESELADEDDDLLDDGDPTIIEDPVDAIDGDPARAWVYTIHEDAALGDHMITVSTDCHGQGQTKARTKGHRRRHSHRHRRRPADQPVRQRRRATLS